MKNSVVEEMIKSLRTRMKNAIFAQKEANQEIRDCDSAIKKLERNV